jgi:hypothetical protein
MWRYRDEAGAVVYVVRRAANKRFWMDGNTSLAARVPYLLPELRAVVANGGEVFIVEGEKDADNLNNAFATHGWPNMIATTSAGGAEWEWPEEWAEYLRGALAVRVICDNDDVGRKCGVQRAQIAKRAVRDVTVLAALPHVGPKGDVSDYLGNGGDVETLYRLCAGAPLPPEPQRGYINVNLASVRPEPVQWLWPQWLPRGKLVVLDGDPALGKSTLALDLAARITTATPFPDGETGDLTGPAPVLILTAEDGLQDTVVPRMKEAGGDLRLAEAFRAVIDVNTGEQRHPSIPEDLGWLEQAIMDIGAVFVVVDVLVAYLGGSVNSHNDANMRAALMPIADVAERTHAAVFALRHLNKSPGGDVLYRGGGSIGIIGAARAGLVVGADPMDPNKRVLAVTKSNLAIKPPSLSYSVVRGDGWDCSRIAWHGEVSYDAASLLNGSKGSDNGDGAPKRIEDAREWLTGQLIDGPQYAAWLYDGADAAGVARRTLERAKSELKVKSRQSTVGGKRHWIWELP